MIFLRRLMLPYTFRHTDSEPGRASAADHDEMRGTATVHVLGYAGLPLQASSPPSPRPSTGPEIYRYKHQFPQDGDEREPMFIQAHDPDFMPEPVYPEYIPSEGCP
ncbi:hypothetical protein Tco_1465788 [Tanacetum coccineum]